MPRVTMGDMAEFLGAAIAVAMPIYAWTQAESHPSRSGKALALLVSVAALLFPAMVAFQWYMFGGGSVGTVTRIAVFVLAWIYAAVAVLFVRGLWRGSGWAVATLGVLSGATAVVGVVGFISWLGEHWSDSLTSADSTWVWTITGVVIHGLTAWVCLKLFRHKLNTTRGNS